MINKLETKENKCFSWLEKILTNISNLTEKYEMVVSNRTSCTYVKTMFPLIPIKNQFAWKKMLIKIFSLG